MENLLQFGFDLLLIATSAVGGASLIVQGLAKVAAITPSTRDDQIVGKVGLVLVTLTRVLDKLALNLPADKARKP